MTTPVDWDVNNKNEQNVDCQSSSSSSSLSPFILFHMGVSCNFPMVQIHALTVFLSNHMKEGLDGDGGLVFTIH